MSSQTFTRIHVAPEAAAPDAVPRTTAPRTNIDAASETNDVPNGAPEPLTRTHVPGSAGLPSSAQPIDWRAALSAASLAAFIAAVAGIGCGARPTMRNPSPATPLTRSFSTLNASDARNPGPVTK